MLWALVPTGVLVAAFAAKAIASPNAVRDVFTSTQALLLTTALAVGWVLLAFVVLPRVIRAGWLRASILGVLAVVIIAVLVVPSFRDTKVVEALPPVVTTSAPEAEAMATPPTTAPVQPERLGTAPLRGIDHDATGAGALYRYPDGHVVVGLEDIDIEPGPDYRLYLVRGAGREEPGDGISLGGLAGNQGTQYYEVPVEAEVGGGDWTILVWCRAFAVPIANASFPIS